jgi:hypothetical protein
MAEMYFPDETALESWHKKAEMAKAGQNLDLFAKGLYSLKLGTKRPDRNADKLDSISDTLGSWKRPLHMGISTSC